MIIHKMKDSFQRLRPILIFAAISLTSNLAVAGYSVTGNTISWSNGWYQVQNPSTSNWNVCDSSSNGSSCTVPNGTYTIINHTTGERTENVQVPSSTSNTSSICSRPSGQVLLGSYYGLEWWQTETYVAGGWKGPICAEYGSPGGYFSVNWENTNNDPSNHFEFDIRVGKNWYFTAASGWGMKTIAQISNSLSAKYSGSWKANTTGRRHVNLTVWLSDKQGGNNSSAKRVDVIIHESDESGNFVQEAKNNKTIAYSDFTQYWKYLGTINEAGSVYDVVERKPGDRGEKASYNLVKKNSPTSGSISGTVNIKSILTKLKNKGNVQFNTNWYLRAAEWTVTGQSAGSGKPASKGGFTFTKTEIPNLN